MMSESFTILSPTVSQLTSMSQYLSGDRKSERPVAPLFDKPYADLLVKRFSTFAAGSALVQDLLVRATALHSHSTPRAMGPGADSTRPSLPPFQLPCACASVG